MDYDVFKNELSEEEKFCYLKAVLDGKPILQEDAFTWQLERCRIIASGIKYSKIRRKYYADKIECGLKKEWFDTFLPVYMACKIEKELLKIASKTINLFKQDCTEYFLKALQKKNIHAKHLSGRGSHRLWQHVEYSKPFGGGIPIKYEVEYDAGIIEVRINGVGLPVTQKLFNKLDKKIDAFFQKEWGK